MRIISTRICQFKWPCPYSSLLCTKSLVLRACAAQPVTLALKPGPTALMFVEATEVQASVGGTPQFTLL